MNKSKIEWCDSTWNPVTGCLHGCEYCYARRIAERFGLAYAPKLGDPGLDGCKYDSSEGLDTMLEINKPYYKGGRIQPYPMAFLPTFHRYRLDEPSRKTKPQKIFVCSMSDLFGEWVPDEWIEEVFKACEVAPQHKYLFLTKNPKRYAELQFKLPLPTAHWYGTTVTCQADTENLKHMWQLTNTFVSIEPMMNAVDLTQCEYDGVVMDRLSGCGINHHSSVQSMPNMFCNPLKWIIIGAQTGPGAIPPKHEWVQSIIDQCRAAGVPVFLKNNLNWPEKIQEYPQGLEGSKC